MTSKARTAGAHRPPARPAAASLPGRLAAAAALAVAVALGAGPASAGAAVIYVDDSAVGGNDGTSWANAFTDLHDALKIAQAGDEIRIAQGTYKPAPPGGDRAISFHLVSGVVMQGGYAGFGAADPDALDPQKFQTILSGDLNGDDGPELTNYGDNTYHVIIADGVSAATEVRGLTIQAGFADASATIDAIGGGIMLINGASPRIRGCIITRNRAMSAAGVAAGDGSPHFDGCDFIDNRASGSPAVTSAGGMWTTGPAVVTNCRFIDNRGNLRGGAIQAWPVSSLLVRSCTFIGNHAEIGGAIWGPSSTVVDCVFVDNSAHYGAGLDTVNLAVNCVFRNNFASDFGGGTFNTRRIVNCAFINNTAGHGGAIYNSAQSVVDSCVIVSNKTWLASSMGGGIYNTNSNSNLTVRNSILWANTHSPNLDQGEGAQITVFNGAWAIENTCILGWTGTLGGIGNHGNDPRFVDADGPDGMYGTEDDDLRLRANSPCIDRGDASLLPADTFDLDEDGDTTEPLPLDLDFLPRVVGANVDMGAFEFQGSPCRADIDGNGAVDVDDLIAVILGWGDCPQAQPCATDLNLNGETDVDDLIAVILGWGPCAK